MNEKIEQAVRAVLKLDPNYNPHRTDAAIQVLKGRSVAGMRKVEKLDHVMTRAEVASNLHIGVHRVDALVRAGSLRRIPPGAKRALGISAMSLKEYQERLQDALLRKLK